MTREDPRDAAPADTVRELVQPSSVTELAACVAEAADAARTLALQGLGTRPAPGAPYERVDQRVELSRLSGVVRASPADLTLRAQAGMPLSTLDALLGEHELWFPPAAYASRGSLGGLLATDAESALQLGYGRAREHVLGATCVHGAGAVTKSRGDVVKNVAGYDVARAMVGSFGTLGALAEVALRVFPRPERRAGLRCRIADLATGGEAVAALRRTQLEPVSLNLSVGRGGVALQLGFDGLSVRVEGQLARASALLRDFDVDEPEILDGEDECARRKQLDAPAEPLEQQLREPLPGAGARTLTSFAVLRVSGPGAALAAAIDAAVAGCTLEACADLRPALGSAWLALGAPTPPALLEELPALVAHLRRRAHVVLHRAPAPLRATPEQVWGPPPPDLALMQRLRSALDPRGVFARGRLVGGL